jgi:hypothetical protein
VRPTRSWRPATAGATPCSDRGTDEAKISWTVWPAPGRRAVGFRSAGATAVTAGRASRGHLAGRARSVQQRGSRRGGAPGSPPAARVAPPARGERLQGRTGHAARRARVTRARETVLGLRRDRGAKAGRVAAGHDDGPRRRPVLRSRNRAQLAELVPRRRGSADAPPYDTSGGKSGRGGDAAAGGSGVHRLSRSWRRPADTPRICWIC